jgi:hypothetical protein
MKLIAKDYDLMRAWLAHMARIAFPASMLMGKADPVAALDKIAATSPAKASSGLSMAIGDLVALTSVFPASRRLGQRFRRVCAELFGEGTSKMRRNITP